MITKKELEGRRDIKPYDSARLVQILDQREEIGDSLVQLAVKLRKLKEDEEDIMTKYKVMTERRRMRNGSITRSTCGKVGSAKRGDTGKTKSKVIVHQVPR